MRQIGSFGATDGEEGGVLRERCLQKMGLMGWMGLIRGMMRRRKKKGCSLCVGG